MDFHHVHAHYTTDKHVYVITQSIADTNVSMQKDFAQHNFIPIFTNPINSIW